VLSFGWHLQLCHGEGEGIQDLFGGVIGHWSKDVSFANFCVQICNTPPVVTLIEISGAWSGAMRVSSCEFSGLTETVDRCLH
jgi:hypothetical protein